MKKIIVKKFGYYVLAHEAILLFGINPGEISCIDGIAGAEYPRTIPIQKYANETDIDNKVYNDERKKIICM